MTVTMSPMRCQMGNTGPGFRVRGGRCGLSSSVSPDGGAISGSGGGVARPIVESLRAMEKGYVSRFAIADESRTQR
jgi:hypothetical protein